MMIDIELTRNNQAYQLNIDPGERLYYVLRRLGFRSVKFVTNMENLVRIRSCSTENRLMLT